MKPNQAKIDDCRNILIIEDEILVAESIEKILKKQGDFNFLIVNNETEALRAVQDKTVKLIISDIRLNNSVDGPVIIKKILADQLIPVIYISAYSDKSYLESALETEPIVYLVKPFLERQLLVAFSIALNKMEKIKLEESILRPSKRELEIIELLARGFNSRDIGNFLFISEHTVKTQRKTLLKKYDVASTYELIALSSKLKWIKND
jgi:DNA-binding NarL/FixJ family response regulator